MSEIPESQEELKRKLKRKLELKEELSKDEYYFYCHHFSYDEKVMLRIEYEQTNYKSGLVNSFFNNLGIILPYLSMNQVEKLRTSLGTINRDFFECTDFISLLSAAVSPLFNTKKYKRTNKEAHDEAVKAQAAAETNATDEAKAFAEYMAAKANVGKAAADKAAFLKSIADKAKAAADKAKAAAEANATDESKAFAKSMFDIFWKANHDSQHANREAEYIVKANTKAEQGNPQIMLFSGEFDGLILENKRYTMDKKQKPYSKFKYCIDKYDPTHLKLAEAILEVAIFILQDLLPPVSVYDEERYKLHLRDIGICDEKSVDELEYDRSRYIDELRNLSYKIKTFFRNGMLNKRSVPPKPKAFHQEVFNSLNANESFMIFLWNTCDTCQKRVDHLEIWRTAVRCTVCGGECPIVLEPTASPAQTSDPVRALATELIDARISFGEQAEKIARMFLQNGVYQLSQLSVLGEETFNSIVEMIGLNEVQVLNLSPFRKK
jgi:hypothetical protein